MSYQRGKVVRTCAIVLAILVFSIHVYAKQQTSLQTYHLFYGKVLDVPDDSKIIAKVGPKNFSTQVVGGQYGYDPEFRITGPENSIIEFYIDAANIANSTLQREGMSRLDLSLKPQKPEVKPPPPANIVQPIPATKPIPATRPRQVTESSSLWLVLLSTGLLITISIMAILYLRRRRVKTVDVESVAYVRNMLNLGYSREQIVEYFRQHGWPNESVEEIFKHL